MSRYISNARTLDELRQEFLTHLQHKLDMLDSNLRQQNPSAVEASRITRARQELLSVYDYWHNLECKGETR